MSVPTGKTKKKSNIKELLLWIIRLIVLVFRKYLRFRAWLLCIPLLIIILMGKLLTKDGILMGLVILVYISLVYLDNWFEKNMES
jgi:hypothetical protein